MRASRTEKQPAGEAYFISFWSVLSIRRQMQAHAHLLLPMLAGHPAFCMRCSHCLTRYPCKHRCVLFKMLKRALNTSGHGSSTTLSLIPNSVVLHQRWLSKLCLINKDARIIRDHFFAWCHTANIHGLSAIHLP